MTVGKHAKQHGPPAGPPSFKSSRRHVEQRAMQEDYEYEEEAYSEEEEEERAWADEELKGLSDGEEAAGGGAVTPYEELPSCPICKS